MMISGTQCLMRTGIIIDVVVSNPQRSAISDGLLFWSSEICVRGRTYFGSPPKMRPGTDLFRSGYPGNASGDGPIPPGLSKKMRPGTDLFRLLRNCVRARTYSARVSREMRPDPNRFGSVAAHIEREANRRLLPFFQSPGRRTEQRRPPCNRQTLRLSRGYMATSTGGCFRWRGPKAAEDGNEKDTTRASSVDAGRQLKLPHPLQPQHARDQLRSRQPACQLMRGHEIGLQKINLKPAGEVRAITTTSG
jgi:hypothetical protein